MRKSKMSVSSHIYPSYAGEKLATIKFVGSSQEVIDAENWFRRLSTLEPDVRGFSFSETQLNVYTVFPHVWEFQITNMNLWECTGLLTITSSKVGLGWLSTILRRVRALFFRKKERDLTYALLGAGTSRGQGVMDKTLLTPVTVVVTTVADARGCRAIEFSAMLKL
jgi:hypothetical protein